MSVFVTSDEQKIKVYEVAVKMNKKGLSAQFILKCVDHAILYEGSHDLMVLWDEADSEKERNEIIADLQDEIDARMEAPIHPKKMKYIKFDDLDSITKDVLKFKNALRKIVDRKGGIARLAEVSGLPQPSLSRFFNSASVPRRTTLYKIADALNLNEKEFVKDWLG